MKKLSIEEKAKRYDEAIQRANELNYISDKDSLQCKTVEHIFPELKESKDDIIRKRIIDALHGDVLEMSEIKEAVDWIEKQDKKDEEIILLKDKIESLESARIAMQEYHRLELEKFEKQSEKTEPIEDFDTEFERQISHLIASIINKEYSYKKAFVKWASGALLNYAKHEIEKQGEPTEINSTEFDSQLNKLLKQFEALPKEELENSLSFYLNVIQNDGTYKEEKQGKQKPVEWHREDEQNLNACLGYIPDEFLRRWLTDIIHIKYDKPTNKVEPKFKVGDWLVDEKGVVKQILSYKKGIYKHTYGYSSCIFEDKWRMWDITKDAKDGDVLAYNDSKNNVWVCIFKKYTNERVYDYCTLDKESFWEHGNWNYLASFSYTPATKEQRDLLFQKMKEAGYEWDANKRELKKLK